MSVRVIDVRERVLARNDEIARDVRARIEEAGVLALNLVSSPGSGKTTLLERTLDALGSELSIAIVTGDVQTQNDADRLARHTSRLVHAVVTGGACHLDASQVARALDAIDLEDTDILFIENVGNLVCPAAWDLGEAAKIVLFSVTEGEDKPVKYPRMFREASHAVISKADLLPYVPFDLERAKAFAREANPEIEFLVTSALTGQGLDRWCDFLRMGARQASQRLTGVPQVSPG
jgi:hydrogenase nickel incorporation protein HypB